MQFNSDNIKNHRYTLLFIAIGIIYVLNLFIDIMDVDAAQYASIALEMFKSGSYLEVFHRGQDYLDKPPLLFWLSTLSFHIFGIHNFAFKLPAVLVLILGIYSTYKFTHLWYTKKTATIAALILASCQALMLMTNDVRTDGILTGFVIFSIWQLSSFLQKGNYKFLIGGSVGIAAALMSKGPIAIIIPAAAFGTEFLLKRQWKNIFRYEWLILLAIVALVISPMCYGLYIQYDLHPEKTVYGLDGPSGIEFFFWTQSFGRITGENLWKDNTTFFHFFHTIIWDFAPWIFAFIIAFIIKGKDILKAITKPDLKAEYLTFGGFLFPFLALSTSNFKLPHYIFPLFPFAAIITADFLITTAEKAPRMLNRIKHFYFGLLQLVFIIAGLSLFIFFPPKTITLHIFLIIAYALFWYCFLKKEDDLKKLISIVCIAWIALNIVMATNFYPKLIKYQGSSEVGKMVAESGVKNFYYYKDLGFAMDYYSNQIVKEVKLDSVNLYPKGTWIYTNKQGYNDIINKSENYVVIHEFEDFHVTGLTLPFLMKDTRSNETKTMFLLEKTEVTID